MSKFNADELNYEEIEVVLGGETYVVKEVKQDMFDKIKLSIEKTKENEEDLDVICEQLGIILNAEPSKFKGLDLRRLTSTLRFLTETITKQVDGSEKND